MPLSQRGEPHRRVALLACQDAYLVPVPTGAIDVYVAAAVARWDLMRRPGQPEVDEPGVHGPLPCADDPLIRLLVTNDRAYDVLATLLPNAQAGMINVFARAARCAELVHGHPAWQSKLLSAMICRDLQSVPAVSLPSELTLRPVQRLAGDAPDGVPLESAVAAALRAAPTIDDPPEALVGFLRSFPPTTRLFATVDRDGAARATSGSGAYGAQATVMLVNTDPDWRGQGIGQAMTAAALRAAEDSGARQACLDATDAGLSIYLRLGFEAVARTTQFFRTG